MVDTVDMVDVVNVVDMVDVVDAYFSSTHNKIYCTGACSYSWVLFLAT